MQEAFDKDTARWEKEYPELTILRQVTFSQPRTALLDAGAEAQLIVVGNRGRGGISGMMLGSVAQAIIHHAPCPAGVVHPAISAIRGAATAARPGGPPRRCR
jgi:nucleotide-binding universal stress UspA family protein